MKIRVEVKPGAKARRVEPIPSELFAGESTLPGYVVRVTEPAKEGKANRAVIKAVAEHLNIAPSRIRIIQGLTSKHKILEIAE